VKIRAILGASILLLVSVQTKAVAINFDDLTVGTFLTDQYASNGIIFDGAWIQGPSTRGSAPNWISGEEITNNSLNPNAITGYFVNPINSSENAITNYFEGLNVYADSDTTVFLDVFDLDGVLLASRSRVDDGILSISQESIHSFSLYHSNGGFSGIDDVIGFDNIMFNDVSLIEPPSPIPIPAAIWLFGTAMIGLVGFSKRRKAA